ncbi:MAG: S41 family peptidase, partial [bacterium]|nr:S41 family peptidase [bacterium]
MTRAWRNTAIFLFAASLLFGGLVGEKLLALTGEAQSQLRLYTELLHLAHENYGDDVEYRDLVYSSIQGMLRTLDPHTTFLTPEYYDRMRERQQASFFGLGILVSMRNDRLTVINPIEGTPAWRLGLRAGDVISAIEGEPTDTMSLDEAVSKLKGPKDTQVNIRIVRRGLREPLDLTITRAEIPQTTVRYAYMMDPGTGYVRLTDFSRSTTPEMHDALDRLRGEGMERLILDLRSNGGGLLDQTVEVSKFFVPERTMVVETRGRLASSYQSFYSDNGQETFDMPLVVLVNNGTASAAEILAGAIQDHDIGLVVGTSTWGKGLVQTVYNLSSGTGLALTTAKYYSPSGRLIQRDYSSYFDYLYI